MVQGDFPIKYEPKTLKHQWSFSLKGWCTWHKTWLQMMILGSLSRVMMVREPFCAKKNMQTSHFLCAKISPARVVLYLQLNQALLWSNRTAQRFNITAGVRNYAVPPSRSALSDLGLIGDLFEKMLLNWSSFCLKSPLFGPKSSKSLDFQWFSLPQQ